MPPLADLASYLDGLLAIAEIPDYPGALNGVQLENEGPVKKVGAAVDACLPVIERAVAEDVDLLIVHHGMFWGGAQPITGAYYRKLKLALEHGLAIYSAHIPLDVHRVFGNNVKLAEALGLEKTEPFFPWKGILLGRRAKVPARDREALLTALSKAVDGPVHCAPGGPAQVRDIGIITGGAGSEVAAAAAEGLDTFITGEGPHHTYTLAEELGINLVYAGHYATETFGVRALAAHLAERFGLEQTFLPHPTGL